MLADASTAGHVANAIGFGIDGPLPLEVLAVLAGLVGHTVPDEAQALGVAVGLRAMILLAEWLEMILAVACAAKFGSEDAVAISVGLKGDAAIIVGLFCDAAVGPEFGVADCAFESAGLPVLDSPKRVASPV